MKCLAKQGFFWGKHSIQSLQALVLLGYAMGHSQDSTWVVLRKYTLPLLSPWSQNENSARWVPRYHDIILKLEIIEMGLADKCKE